MTSDAVKQKINSMMGSSKGDRFVTSIISAVSNNAALNECTHVSIFSAALVGETLGLSPSPQLGHFYLVPYNDKKQGKVAQFQIGYKGYIQLAIRSGQYKKINVVAIKEGELVSYDPLNEEIEVNLIDNEEERENKPTIGYYAMFEYINGFRKTMYWSKNKMTNHALKYSPGFKAKKGYTFWEKDFDGMAFKTMLRQLLSKWGIMSIEMQDALQKDTAVILDDDKYEYVDTPEDELVIDDTNEIEEANAEIVENQEQDSFFPED